MIEVLDERVAQEIAALPKDMQARLLRFGDLIQEHGFLGLPRDAVKHVEDKLWELRLTGRSGISRVVYLTVEPQRVVFLRAFIKKTQKMPGKELRIARERAKEVR